MSLESQYGNKKIFSHQFQIYVKLENCDFSLKDRIFPVFCRIFNPKVFYLKTKLARTGKKVYFSISSLDNI